MKGIYAFEGIKELTNKEQQNIEGGSILGGIALGLGLLSGACLLAYGGGYAYGKAEQYFAQ